MTGTQLEHNWNRIKFRDPNTREEGVEKIKLNIGVGFPAQFQNKPRYLHHWKANGFKIDGTELEHNWNRVGTKLIYDLSKTISESCSSRFHCITNVV